MADMRGKLNGINNSLANSASTARSIGSITRGGSSSGKPSTANSNYDRADNTVGTEKAKNIRYNQANDRHNQMLKNESAVASNQEAHNRAGAGQAQRKKFDVASSQLEGFKAAGHLPGIVSVNPNLNTKQSWHGKLAAKLGKK